MKVNLSLSSSWERRVVYKKGKTRVLVTEDEHSVALQIAATLRSEGWTMVGPFASLAEAVEKARVLDIDCAVLDGDLKGEPTDPVAEILIERNIPFVCTVDERRYNLPAVCHERYPVVPKPIQDGDLLLALRCVLPMSQGGPARRPGRLHARAQVRSGRRSKQRKPTA